MFTIHDVEQRSSEWFELRANKITASNAWKLLLYGKNKALEPAKPFTNIWTQRGNALEPEAIELYEKIKGINVMQVGFITNTKFDNCGASPDGITDRLIEVKCFNKEKHLIINEDNIPFQVMAQVQFSMMICELDKTDLVLYNPDLDAKNALKIIEIKQDNLIVKHIKSKLK